MAKESLHKLRQLKTAYISHHNPGTSLKKLCSMFQLGGSETSINPAFLRWQCMECLVHHKCSSLQLSSANQELVKLKKKKNKPKKKHSAPYLLGKKSSILVCNKARNGQLNRKRYHCSIANGHHGGIRCCLLWDPKGLLSLKRICPLSL